MIKEDKKKSIFKTRPEKASSRIAINSFMIGSLFFALTLIWTFSPEKFSFIVICQLMLAIPLLFVSSLAYTKISYLKNAKLWDVYGWFTNTIGNAFILNAIGLMTAQVFSSIAWLYFSLILFLMLIYSIINCIYYPGSRWEKIFKFIFFAALIYFGGILHLI